MEQASQRREASWRWHPGGIFETSGFWEASGRHLGRRLQGGGGSTEEGIIEEETSWRRHMEEASWRRHHGGGITEEGGFMEEASWRHPGSIRETSGRHLGGIWDASGKHLGGSWRHLGGVWGLSGDLGYLGGSRLINAHHSMSVCVFLQKVLKNNQAF